MVTPRPGASLAWAGEIPDDLCELDSPTSPRFAAVLDATDPFIPVVRKRNPTFWNVPRLPRRNAPAEPGDSPPRPGEYTLITSSFLARVLAGLDRI